MSAPDRVSIPPDHAEAAAPPAGHRSSITFWAWFIVMTVVLLFVIAAVISIEVPDTVSIPVAIALNASNLVVSCSAGYILARRQHRNGIWHSPLLDGPRTAHDHHWR